ncbi:MAG: lysine--tRNA ligase [Candidatus Thermoplasmatota archaeon]|nr:lysine--tRNA ligase [Candidatus Thermoplasmatota archaeon]
MHWADVVAEKLLESGSEHVISSGITPSGPIHLGSMREILTADAIVKAVNGKGGKAKLVYIADNADPLRKVYPFLNKEKYKNLVGFPLAELPAPDGDGSYDQYFLNPFFEALERVGVYPEVVNNYRFYQEGRFEECTKYIIDERETVKEILETISGRQLPGNWFPWTFKNNDGKLCTGKVIKYDWPHVTFENEKGEEVTNNMAKGEGKLPWRLDWPSKWKILGVTFEAFGKDHATKGGSYDTGKEIIEKILACKVPHHIAYEWINLKGEGAMHSSTGLAISAEQMLKIAPPEVIRWLIMHPLPNRHIDFDPGIGLLNSVDKYDRIEQDYYENKLEENSARAFELSQIQAVQEKKPQMLPYRHLVTLNQSKNGRDEIVETLRRTGYVQKLDENELDRLETRTSCIDEWLEKYAPESVKFVIQKEPPEIEFSKEDLDRVKQLKKMMEKVEWTPDEIHDSFYDIQEASKTPAKEYFRIMYSVILGKERGPRLGFFLATMEREFITERLGSY